MSSARGTISRSSAAAGWIFIDVSESEVHQRADVSKLNQLLRDEKPLGKIAVARISSSDPGRNRAGTDTDTPDWLDLQVQANALLRDTNPGQFADKLGRLQSQLARFSRRNADATLFALIYLAATEIELYSATHAILVRIICSLAARVPMELAAAMQATYFDEQRQIDEAGAALIKAVGIDSPGSFVSLATNEIGVVLRRGANTTTPRVADLVNRGGMPTGEQVIRDTSPRDYRVVASVAHRDVKVKINMGRMLALTAAQNSSRPW